MLHWARINIVSTVSRNGLSKALEDSLPGVPWKTIIEVSSRMIAEHLRKPEPAVELEPRRLRPGRWFVNPFIPAGEITVLYGDGGTGKSLLALAIAVAGLLGHPMTPPWKVAPIDRVLYLDWESDAETHGERLHALTHRRELVQKGAILHRRLWRPLTDTIDVIRTDAARHQAELIICDSLGAACGSEPESADAAVRTLMALRSLPGTKLLIAHVSKASAEQQRSRPYGSVYVANLARSIIEARRTELVNSRVLSVSLYPSKTNTGRLGPSSAVTFEWDDDETIDVSSGRPDVTSMSLASQVMNALLGGHRTTTDLAEELRASAATLRVILGRLQEAGHVTRVGTAEDAQGHRTEAMWGLLARELPPDER